MLNTSLTDFLLSIHNLEDHISKLESEKSIINFLYSLDLSDDIKHKLPLWTQREEKVFQYNSNIISLYGYLERYIENVITEYIRFLSKIEPDFKKLPEKVQKSYFELIKNFHGKLAYPKYNGFKETDLVNSLYHALSEQKNDIIAEVFYKNGGNYRYDVINDCISSLGIKEFNLLCKYPDLSEYYQDKGIRLDQESPSSLFEMLDDLVVRRNDIAHGAVSDNLIDCDIFRDYIDFITRTVKSINTLLNDALLGTIFESNNNENEVFKPLKYFDKQKVIAVNKIGLFFSKGDKLLCAHPNGHYPRYQQLTIESMEHNRYEFLNFSIEKEDDIICLKVDTEFNLNEKCRLCQLRQ